MIHVPHNSVDFTSNQVRCKCGKVRHKILQLLKKYLNNEKEMRLLKRNLKSTISWEKTQNFFTYVLYL